MAYVTSQDLAQLERAYARGVLRVREGDTWIEYNSMDQMARAIDRLRLEVTNTKPTGSRLISVSKGY
tara:strand:- start:1389 stop:1589 length:201 start_codon:yes stop_codon:yes gene_type:complete